MIDNLETGPTGPSGVGFYERFEWDSFCYSSVFAFIIYLQIFKGFPTLAFKIELPDITNKKLQDKPS